MELFPKVAGQKGSHASVRQSLKETILLVEDEEMVRKLMLSMLRNEPYALLEADSPEAALRLAREFPGHIDLLITDLMMPKMDGAELAKAVAAVRPGIRVLFMSGYTDAGSVVNGGPPAERFLHKPFTAASLIAVIEEILGES